jgi:hypothetical protein
VKRFFVLDVSLLITDILILLICFGGLYLISIKAGLPFKTSIENSALVVSENPGKIFEVMVGDEIISIDNHHFSKWGEVYLDAKNICENIYLEIKRNDLSTLVTVELKNYYTLFDLTIISLAGSTFLVMGVFVRIKASDNYSAHIFHWASLGLGMVIINTTGHLKDFMFQII